MYFCFYFLEGSPGSELTRWPHYMCLNPSMKPQTGEMHAAWQDWLQSASTASMKSNRVTQALRECYDVSYSACFTIIIILLKIVEWGKCSSDLWHCWVVSWRKNVAVVRVCLRKKPNDKLYNETSQPLLNECLQTVKKNKISFIHYYICSKY